MLNLPSMQVQKKQRRPGIIRLAAFLFYEKLSTSQLLLINRSLL
jgi:hypothetical protein